MNQINESILLPEEFNTKEKCLDYLYQLKWGKGYRCSRCNHSKSIKGRMWYYKRCQSCKWDESCTAGTLFHKLKFPLTTAFALIYQLSDLRKGLSCHQISRQYDIQVVTAWIFRAKVQLAMSGKKNHKFDYYIRKCVKEKKVGKKKSVTVHLSCSTGKRKQTKIGLIRYNGEYNSVQKWGRERWSGMRGKNYRPRKSKKCMEIDLQFMNTDKRNVTQLFILNMKNWIGGVHHFVSLAYLEMYIREFEYRFERRSRCSIDNARELLSRMVIFNEKQYRKAYAN